MNLLAMPNFRVNAVLKGILSVTSHTGQLESKQSFRRAEFPSSRKVTEYSVYKAPEIKDIDSPVKHCLYC